MKDSSIYLNTWKIEIRNSEEGPLSAAICCSRWDHPSLTKSWHLPAPAQKTAKQIMGENACYYSILAVGQQNLWYFLLAQHANLSRINFCWDFTWVYVQNITWLVSLQISTKREKIHEEWALAPNGPKKWGCRMRIRDLFSKTQDLFINTRLWDQKNSRWTWTPWTP